MSAVSKWEVMLDVALRIPPLFLMDSVLNKSFLSFLFPYDPLMTWKQFTVWLFLMAHFFVCGLMMFFLSVRQLLEIYSYTVNILALCFSYWWNYSFVNKMSNETSADLYAQEQKTLLQALDINNSEVYSNFFAQFIFAWTFYIVWAMRKSSDEYGNFMKSAIQTAIHFSFISPIMVRGFLRDSELNYWTPLLAIVYPAVQISHDFLSSLKSLVFFIRRSYVIIKITISAIGVQAFVEDQWNRLRVPQVLRLFCLLRILYQISCYISWPWHEKPPQLNSTDDVISENMTLIAQNMLVRSCETVVALLGTTSIISYIAHYVGLFMALCIGSNTEEDRNMGTVSAILFFILALQTGLTGLDADKRLIRLYRNFALLSTAILHFVHSMVNPVLLTLSASRNVSIQKHARALGMCAFLILFPTILVYYLWCHHSASPWLLAVTAFSIEVIMKVSVSLTVYSLFMIDAYRDTFWEGLDDYVYYVQSTGNTIEFIFGIFLFCNGGWIMVFESGGAIRAFMMCIHAYFNIFVQAKEGWKVFMKRRTAVNKINLLREASAEELAALNDVCAICYQELRTARVTRCNHYFHSVCLRKWLYVQDNCPLCHKVLYKSQENGAAGQTSENMDAANQNVAEENMANNIHQRDINMRNNLPRYHQD